MVFIIGLEDGLLPHASSMSSEEEFEEERRLCYVGFTRARQKLFISNARRRRIFGTTQIYPPSEFLLSIPSEVLHKEASVLSVRLETSANDTSFPKTYRKRESRGEEEMNYAIGTKVIHPTFGTGVVINREGSDDDLKVDIFFKKPYGKKKLAVNMAKLIVL